jgi:hypothetical protein
MASCTATPTDKAKLFLKYIAFAYEINGLKESDEEQVMSLICTNYPDIPADELEHIRAQFKNPRVPPVEGVMDPLVMAISQSVIKQSTEKEKEVNREPEVIDPIYVAAFEKLVANIEDDTQEEEKKQQDHGLARMIVGLGRKEEQEEEEQAHPPGCMCGVQRRQKDIQPEKVLVMEPRGQTDAVLLFPLKGGVSITVHSQVLSIHSAWFALVFQGLALEQSADQREKKRPMEYSFASVEDPLLDIPWIVVYDLLYRMYNLKWEGMEDKEERLYSYKNWVSMYKLMNYWDLSKSITDQIIADWQDNLQSIAYAELDPKWKNEIIPHYIKVMFGPLSDINPLRPLFTHGMDNLTLNPKRASRLYQEFKHITTHMNRQQGTLLDHIPAICLQNFFFWRSTPGAIDRILYNGDGRVIEFDAGFFVATLRFLFFHKEHCRQCNPKFKDVRLLGERILDAYDTYVQKYKAEILSEIDASLPLPTDPIQSLD